MKLLTLILVIVSGGTNWFATENSSSTNRYEIERARDQVNQMYNHFDDIERQQQETAKNVTKILENTNKLLRPSPTP